MPKIVNWVPFTFIVTYHVLLIALFPLFLAHFSWLSLLLAVIAYFLGGISITAGYHRLFSHKSYVAHPWLERLVLFFSTLAFQNSALMWSHDHRLHHKHVDTDKDPYSIEKGFWYAHIWWIFSLEYRYDRSVVPDLEKNPRVMFQHRNMLALTIVANLLVVGLAALVVHPVAAIYAVFVLRVFCIHHSTWFINSLAHTWGAKTYVRELSAVDNAILAVLTFGEGYHNYHHAFASDYRNGIRWYHYDVTKWLIWLASKIGWAENLKTVSDLRIRQQLVKKDRDLILGAVPPGKPHLDQLRKRVEHLSASFETASTELSRRLRQLKSVSAKHQHALEDGIHRGMEQLRSATAERQGQLEKEVRRIQEEVSRLQERVREDWENWKVLTREVSDLGLLPAHH